MCVDNSSGQGLENSKILNPLESQAREYRSTSASAGTQPEWSSVWSNRLCVLPDRLFDLTPVAIRESQTAFFRACMRLKNGKTFWNLLDARKQQMDTALSLHHH
jgi:hypothetical protein